MQMALPPTLGWWADSQFKTTPWLLIVGAVLGFTVSMFELVKLAKDSEDSSE
jgi:F0F1-type ATP synthase assembly protein I